MRDQVRSTKYGVQSDRIRTPCFVSRTRYSVLRTATCLLLRLSFVTLLATGLFPALQAEEPAKKPAEKEVTPQKALEDLGSATAPAASGKARVRLFGLVGEGYKFAYVFDRSGSMGGDGRESLRAVKAELVQSLKGLGRVHQFQIIFYNERAVLFNPSGTSGRLAFATDENKDRAARFLNSITAEGGTAHEDALRLAIRLRPDVIFFLTDGDEPKLTPAQLQKISERAAGIVIHCIEFGPGPKPAGTSFLADLARQNGGKYAYVDISKRRTAAPVKVER
jgi:hypothetical protein